MMSRRSLLAVLSACPFVGAWIRRPQVDVGVSLVDPPSGFEVLQSFDAQDWAKAFVAHVRANPAIPLDEATMTGWFANALMRGYDERNLRIAEDIHQAVNAQLIACIQRTQDALLHPSARSQLLS